MIEREIKEVIWIGSSRRDMQELPLPVRRVFGVALYAAQLGEKPEEIDLVKSRLKVAEELHYGKR